MIHPISFRKQASPLQRPDFGIINKDGKPKGGNGMDLMEAIKERRSIRRYKPDPVSEEVLQKVIEAVRWSPSWANTQCWEVIVSEPNMKSELTNAFTTTNPARSSITEAPLVVVLCGKKGVSGFKKGEAATAKGDWLMFDTGIAMQTLCLAAHSLGLGTVIVGMFDHQKGEILGPRECRGHMITLLI
jgi:nitroreductase